MLSGKDLGAAIGKAIKLKRVTQAQVAAEFGVRQSSVAGWIKTGRIGKQHLEHLVGYFSDVVDAGHWGLHRAAPIGPTVRFGTPTAVASAPAAWPFELVNESRWLDCSDIERAYIQFKLEAIFDEVERKRAAKPMPSPNGGAGPTPAPTKRRTGTA